MGEQIIELNGREASFRAGQTILEAAAANGVDIPTLCHLEGAAPIGRCGICLVDLEGSPELVKACSTPAEAGMVVRTDSSRVVEARRRRIEYLLASGSHNCLVQDFRLEDWTDRQMKAMAPVEHRDLCPAYGDCRLQELAIEYRARPQRNVPDRLLHPTEEINPFIIRDFSRCILCGRCIAACHELVANRVLRFDSESFPTKVVTEGDKPYHESSCVFCGQCVEVCPTGALTEKKARGMGLPFELKKIRTTCPYCGVGCQMWLHVKDERIVRVTPVTGGAPNRGRLCVKGRFGYDFIYSKERLDSPLIRDGDSFRRAAWDEALDLVAGRFKEIIAQHGPDAIAGVSCARSINEDSYQMQKLFRAVIGTNNIDHCART